jgi:type IV pilus assembly protein PilQ
MVAPANEIAERERQEIENNKQIEELAALQTEHLRIRYAEATALNDLFVSGGGDSSSSILSERGSVIVDERTNSLLITETAQKLEEIRRIVKLLDIPIRQVLIEARIVIANSGYEEQLGIKWGAGGTK